MSKNNEVDQTNKHFQEKPKKATKKTKTAKATGNQMNKVQTIVTVAITVAVIGVVSAIAFAAYSKGVKTGEANQVKLQSTIQEAVQTQLSKAE
jgi:hypothetical protein